MGGRGLESRRVKEVEPPSKYKKEETPASEDFYFFSPLQVFFEVIFSVGMREKTTIFGLGCPLGM